MEDWATTAHSLLYFCIIYREYVSEAQSQYSTVIAKAVFVNHGDGM